MKKLLVCLFLGTCAMYSAAQTATLSILKDSLPTGGFGVVETFNGKLYTLPTHIGGDVYEVDQNTGATNLVANIPTLPTSPVGWEYKTSSGNFVFLKNKTVVSLMGTNAGGKNCQLAVGLGTVDTLLTDHSAFGRILSIDTMCYLIFANNTATLPFLYATNLNAPVSKIDSSVIAYKQGISQLFYIRNNAPTYYDYSLRRTNGIGSWVVENVSGTNMQMALIGEVNGEMYYTVSQRAIPASNNVITIKKCDVNGVVSVIDTINSEIAVFENGLVGFNGKLIIPVKHETTPYHQDLVIYDLATNSYINITQNNHFIGVTSLDFQQTNVAPSNLFFKTFNPDADFISNGTIAGTKKYGTLAGTFSNHIGFENYETDGILGNKAQLCNEYPIGNLDEELFVGSDTGRVRYKLWQNNSSYPSHFRQIGSSIFFKVHTGNYTKMTLLKYTGCDIPQTNPLGLKDINQLEAKVYPNPSNGNIHIAITEPFNTQSVKVYNQIGQEVEFKLIPSYNGFELSLIHAQSGVYFLAIHTDIGSANIKLMID